MKEFLNGTRQTLTQNTGVLCECKGHTWNPTYKTLKFEVNLQKHWSAFFFTGCCKHRAKSAPTTVSRMKKINKYIYGTFKKKTCTLLLPIHWTQLPFSQLNQKRMTPSPGLNKVLSREGHAGTASMWCTNSRAACARVPTGEVAVDMQEPVADEGYDIPP